MEDFVVSARKYRPETFDTVVGQKSITTTLKNAIKNNQIAQAFLFTGPRGVGKTTCARILAKTINCLNLTENMEPCNGCASCKSFNDSASFNVHELDAASNNSVDDIRSLVEQVRIPPQAVKYKVYIIDEVHMLSSQAFNAFLKTLEEPPHYAKFILATTEKHKILPTILSRCQIFDFNRITVDDIAKHLAEIAIKEKITAEPEALHIIAQKADGGLRDALSIFDQIASFSGSNITYENVLENLNILDINVYFEISEFIFNNNISHLLLKINDIYEKGHDAHHFINELGDHMRNLLVSKDVETIALLETSQNIKEKYKAFAKNWNANILIKCIEICNKADLNYKNAGNKRLLIELSMLQMCSFFNAVEAKPTFVTEKEQSYQPPQVVKPIEKKVEEKPLPKEAPVISKPKEEEKNELAKGSVSLSTLYEDSEKKEEPQETHISEIPEKEMPADAYTEAQLHEAWKKYAEIETHSPNYKSVITNSTPQVSENDIVIYKVINPFQESEMKTNLQKHQEFLHKELNNFKIKINVVVEAQEEGSTTRPFTVKDKYKSMSEQNPDIAKLKNRLELDFDY